MNSRLSLALFFSTLAFADTPPQVINKVCDPHMWFQSITPGNPPICTQPRYSDLLGTPPTGATNWGSIFGTLSNQTDLQSALNAKQNFPITGPDLPNPSSSSLGGVQSHAAVTHQWLNAISTSGVPAASQPAFSDISGTTTPAQLPLFDSTHNGAVTASGGGTTNFLRADGTWAAVGSGAGAILQGGNSFGAPIDIGSNDNQSVSIKTNGTDVVTILPSGSVGLSNNSPTDSKLSMFSTSAGTSNWTGLENDTVVTAAGSSPNGYQQGAYIGVRANHPSGTLDLLRNYFTAELSGNGEVTETYGGRTISRLFDYNAPSDTSSGIIDRGYGLEAYVGNLSTAGTIRDATGIYISRAQATTAGGGSDTGNDHTAIGLRIDANIAASGGDTNTTYAIKSEATAPSTFAGDLTAQNFLPAQNFTSNVGTYSQPFLSFYGGAVSLLSNGNVVNMFAPSLTGSYNFFLPLDNGTGGQFLQNDGAGNWSWQNPLNIGSPVANGTSNNILFVDGSGNLGNDSTFTFGPDRMFQAGTFQVDNQQDGMSGAYITNSDYNNWAINGDASGFLSNHAITFDVSGNFVANSYTATGSPGFTGDGSGLTGYAPSFNVGNADFANYANSAGTTPSADTANYLNLYGTPGSLVYQSGSLAGTDLVATTDGSGNITAASFTTSGTLAVGGSSSLDNSAIETDGSGNIISIGNIIPSFEAVSNFTVGNVFTANAQAEFESSVTVHGDFGLEGSGANPNTAVYLDGFNVLKSSVTTDTELGYLSGVTSAIQTQLNAKGSGTVTSVGFSVPASSIFAATGSPVTGAGTLGLTVTGTSGGIPYFSTTSALSSSAALTNHAIVLGGGAGAAPTALGSLGTTTTLLHGAASGAPTFSAVSLTADVSSVLPIANGGTNSSSALVNNEVMVSNAGKITESTVSTTNLASLDTTTSLTTQLAGKQATGNYITALTGDATASGPGSVAATLATVNSNVGSFTNGSFTVNGKGLITAASSGATPEVPLTFSTGLTRTVNTVTVNTSQNIATLSNLTGNGFVKTSGGAGTLSIDTNTYLTGNQSITLSGDVTGSGTTAITTAIGTNKVANTQLAQAPTLTLKGNNTGGTANEADLTVSQVNTMLGSLSNPMTTLGDIIYENATPAVARLAGNTTSTVNFLAQTGTGSVSAAPAWTAFTAPTVQTFTSGSGTYTLPTSPRKPLYISIKMVGAGGGGTGSGTAAIGSGGAGGNTTFGTSLLVANGGASGTTGTGGTASLGTGPIGVTVTGSSGSMSVFISAGNAGAAGGNAPFFSGGAAEQTSGAAGNAGITNTGGGGGGAGTNGTGQSPGNGGGAGGFVDAIISSPSSTYSYAVGAAGTGGTAGTLGLAGGAGGSGYIIVTEYYQ